MQGGTGQIFCKQKVNNPPGVRPRHNNKNDVNKSGNNGTGGVEN